MWLPKARSIKLQNYYQNLKLFIIFVNWFVFVLIKILIPLSASSYRIWCWYSGQFGNHIWIHRGQGWKVIVFGLKSYPLLIHISILYFYSKFVIYSPIWLIERSQFWKSPSYSSISATFYYFIYKGHHFQVYNF